MKKPSAALAVLTLGILQLEADPPTSRVADLESAGYTAVEKGQHYTRWSRTILQTNQSDPSQVTIRTNSFVQVGSGLNRWDGTSWTASEPRLMATNGGVLAYGAAHTAFFTENANTYAACQIAMPGGGWFKAHVVGLAYQDVSTGTNVLIAALDNSAPQIVGDNQVLYTNALTGDVTVGLLYVYNAAGVSQQVLLGSRPPPPQAYGLSAESTHLIVISEIDEAPTPTAQERTWRSGRELMRDQTLRFGPMTMVPGRVFALDADRRRQGKPVAKSYDLIDNRRFILERVRYPEIQADLSRLQFSVTNASGGGVITNGSTKKITRWFAKGHLPAIPGHLTADAAGAPNVPRVASLTPARAFVLDYEMVYEEESWFFYTGQTWLVCGEMHLGSAEFQTGSCVKYDFGSSLYVDGPLAVYDCGGTVLLTSINDDENGQWIDGWNSGNPQLGDYGPALVVRPEDLSLAEQYTTVLYGVPGVISGVSIPSVTVAASDASATKGTADTARFALTRAGGDFSQELTVNFTVGGTATPGVDYTALGTSATFGIDQETVSITVTPSAQSGTLPISSVALQLVADPGGSYTIDTPDSAFVYIDDPGAPCPAVPAPDGLISWWRGEGDCQDSLGSNHGTPLNNLGFASGMVAQAFNFDGLDDRLTVPDSPTVNFGQGANFSIEAWIQPLPKDTTYNIMSIVDKRYAPNIVVCHGYELCLNDGRLYFHLSDSITHNGSFFGPTGPDLRDGRFHHVAASVDRSSTQGGHLFVDGQLVLTFDPTTERGDLSNSDPLRIGNHATSWFNSYFKGRIDEVSLYNRALSDTEIAAILNAYRGGKTLQFAATGWKSSCDDKFYVRINNTSGTSLMGGRFDLFVYFDGATRTFLRNLQPWGASDVLSSGASRLFTFCSTDHSVTNFDCDIVYEGAGLGAACPEFRIVTGDNPVLTKKNKTQIANPCLECNNCGENEPPSIPPRNRLACDNGVYNCAPDPCGVWPFPLPASSSSAGAWQLLDNFYKPSDPPEYSNPACPKRGFKNVYAIKQWHGIFGPMSDGRGVPPSSMTGDCGCQTPGLAGSTPDTTKYLAMQSSGSFTSHYLYQGMDYPESGTVSRSCSVNPSSGKVSYGGSNSGDAEGAYAAIRNVHVSELPGIYCQKVAEYAPRLKGLPAQQGPVDIAPRFTSGPSPAMEWNYSWRIIFPCPYSGTAIYSGHSTGFVRLDLAAGTYSCSYDYSAQIEFDNCDGDSHSEVPDIVLENETISINGTAVTSHKTWYSGNGGSGTIWGESDGSVTYSQPYTATEIDVEIDVLLSQWNLLDDVEYPWRNDGGTTRGPLVTRNERGAAAPNVNFSLVNLGTEETPIWQPPQDESSPPWPSQPDGAILGAPLPVHGPSGELYSYEPYFNFYHENYRFEESGRGHPQGFIQSYGAFSPFPNATQWINDSWARFLPAGPFWAYGSAWAEEDHLLFRLKNPYITDTLGVWEQGGAGACLIKCKWAETLDAAAPSGQDFVFKDWKFNFRDFVDSYHFCSAAWYRNNIQIPNGSTCPAISGGAPVRFTPIIIPPEQAPAGYYIGPGSYWIYDMTCTPLHYDFDCCRPAVYVQPNSPDPDCANGVFVPMPPAVCDERFGSLWMGRVDQTTGDSDACDNYVANRNNAVPNSLSCDPQIELDLVWHSFPLGGGAYELFVAPMPLDYGTTPPATPTVQIDIARKNGEVVPQEEKDSNGSVVQIVPQANPSDLYPAGIFLTIPTLSVDPPSAMDRIKVKLQKTSISPTEGRVRVYRRTPGQANFVIFLDELAAERVITAADLGCEWKLDSTAGGVVDLALIAQALDGTELTRDTVRVSSIPCDPAVGRIVFVNPFSSSPAAPYDNFLVNAAHSIGDAVGSMQADDNILIASGSTYAESGIAITTGGVIAGLAGRWKVADPPTDTYPWSDLFDFSSLPTLNNTFVGPWVPVFTAIAPRASPSGTLTIGGLLFHDCAANTTPGGSSGAAIHLESLDPALSAAVTYCRFDANLALDYGGAVYLSHVPTASIFCCEFEGNRVERVATSENEYDRTMGGAIASIESGLTIQDCAFSHNLAQVNGGYDPGSGQALEPPLGSAAGGGDVYVTNGVFNLYNSRSIGAVAGIARRNPISGAPEDASKFTGDGGSILIHGHNTSGAAVQIANCMFVNPAAFGNGGAVSLSYDSSPAGRSYIDSPLTRQKPDSLSGRCSGRIANTVVYQAAGGWQGGAVSVNGRLMQLLFEDCLFQNNAAGSPTAAVEQGKGGAVSVCGGIQRNLDPEGLVTISHCPIIDCLATANGGGLYCTIRGNVSVSGGTQIQQCTAEKAGAISAQTSGQGGGIHVSAGGFVVLDGAEISDNVAKGNGGGLSVRSATATLQGTVSILRNHANGPAAAGWGNGGGIWVTTGRHDNVADGAVAYVFSNDGTLISTSSGTTISQNQASRWGGGLYVGWPVPGELAGTVARLENATVLLNQAGESVTTGGASLLPAQITGEQAADDVCQGQPDGGVICAFPADLRFHGTIVTGRSPLVPDIGIYLIHCTSMDNTPPPPIMMPGTCATDVLVVP